MKYIKDIEIKNKKVLLRCDFNVTIKNNEIIDDYKIIRSLNTINYLLENNNSIIILSHLGKVKSEEDKEKNTLYPVYNRLKELLNTNVYFSKYTRGKEIEKIVNSLKEREILLIENTRHEDFPEKLESKCDKELSKYWASLADFYINDAFGSSHRRHASTFGIKEFLPSAYGLLINEEVSKLKEIIDTPKKPFTIIMGGAKIDDKLPIISRLIDNCDYLIVGGGIANSFLKADNINIGNSIYSEEHLEEVKKLLDKYKNKIIIPNDFYVENNNQVYYRLLNQISDEDTIYDIGEKSLQKFKEIIKESNTIFVNGTVGLYENENFKKGTLKLLNILKESNAKVFIGGGDAVSSVNKLGFKDKFYYQSTGGGATLEFITDGTLLALED